MKYLVVLLLPVIFGLFIGSILSANPAFGLSCAITNMTGNFEETDAIFLGKALSKEYQPNPRHEVTLFSVIEPYKGIYQEKIKVTSSVGPWGVNFTENSNYVVFANNNEGNLEHALCTPTQLASESNLSEIRKISQNYILPPLSQIDFGVNPNEIQCKQNLVLIQKYDGTPACVTESTKQKLIERGWTSKDSTVSVNECEKGVPSGDDLVFFDCKWVEVPYGWTYENGRWQEDPAILKLGPEPEPSCPEDTVCTCDGKYGFYNKTTNRCASSPYMPQYYQRNCEQYADLDYEGWVFDAKECDWNQLND